MEINSVKENICVNRIIASKKEIIFVEGDMIVPDSKPDILSTICTSGVVCIYKKEVLDEKIRIDGCIQTYIMYLADDSQDKVRGLQTNLDFSEAIQMVNSKEGMNCRVESNLKSIECKVINGRKVGVKATIELNITENAKDEIEVINNIQNAEGMQMLKEDLRVNSLVGMGDTKIYAKDNISIDAIDNLAEIIKMNARIVDKDIKVSYNKILTKAEAEIKMMYLTEDNRINSTTARIPIVGFIDIPNVAEENISDVNYEIRNMIMKPNSAEEHSIYVELEVAVMAIVYEEKTINLIQDLYSPIENIVFNKKKITTITGKKSVKESKQIREKVQLEGLGSRRVVDVDVMPVIQKEVKSSNRISYEGEIELKFVLASDNLEIDTRMAKIPFDYVIKDIEDGENMNSNMEIEVTNQDFIVQEGGIVASNIDMLMNSNLQKNINLNMLDQIQSNGEREDDDYNIIMYIVKKGDSLWKIAKRFGSTIENIAKINGIEDVNKIYPGQKLFIPKYRRGMNMKRSSVMEHV